MSVFIDKKIKEVKQIVGLFYGPRYTRKQLSSRFHDWRRSSARDPKEKQQIIIDGSRSQVSEYSKLEVDHNLAILWLIICFYLSFLLLLISCLFTVFSQFSHSTLRQRKIRESFLTILHVRFYLLKPYPT